MLRTMSLLALCLSTLALAQPTTSPATLTQRTPPPPDPAIQKLIAEYVANPTANRANAVIHAVRSFATIERFAPGQPPDTSGWVVAAELCTQVIHHLAQRPHADAGEAVTVERLLALLRRADAARSLMMPALSAAGSQDPQQIRAAEALLLQAGFFRPVTEAGRTFLEGYVIWAPGSTEQASETMALLVLKHVPPLPAFETIWASWVDSMRAKRAISYAEGRDLLNSIQPLRRHLAFPGPESRAAAAAVVQQLSVSPTPWLRAYAIAVMAHPPADLRDDDLLKTLAADNHRLVRETLRLKFPELLPTPDPATP